MDNYCGPAPCGRVEFLQEVRRDYLSRCILICCGDSRVFEIPGKWDFGKETAVVKLKQYILKDTVSVPRMVQQQIWGSLSF